MNMILITDILFPSKYAKWRTEECKSFINEYSTDFLVHKINSYAGVQYDVDYEDTEEEFRLNNYNIIIFDSKFNYLNKYNKIIDGTKFNTNNNFSYLFTKQTTFDIKKYNIIYHIFLSMYKKFNESFQVPKNKQFIHLYPGGGLAAKGDLQGMDKATRIISTNPITTKWLQDINHRNNIEVLGSTQLQKNDIPHLKKKNNQTIKIAFSNLGSPDRKGAPLFKLIAEKYKEMYPSDNIEFIGIGNCKHSKNIIPIEPMPIKQLQKFYRDKIDIVLNLEDGKAFNGWPLGIEAALEGAVLITTDVHDTNKYMQYPENSLFIVEKDDYRNIIRHIKKLHDDRNLLQVMSSNIQKHSFKMFSYENQQQKIFDFLNSSINMEKINIYRQICPASIIDNKIFNILHNRTNLIEQSNVIDVCDDITDLIFGSIKDGKKLTLARYNDGEWISLLYIKDNNLYKIHSVKWDKDGQNFVDTKIKPILSEIDYPIGISTEVFKKPAISKNIYEYIKDLDIFDGGLFARWSITGELDKFLNVLKDKDVIIVGPEYLKSLNSHLNFKHIITTDKVWNQYDELFTNIQTCVKDGTILLYCCSFAAKRLIHDFKDKNLIQLDIGAAFDEYCGIKSRPWHLT